MKLWNPFRSKPERLDSVQPLRPNEGAARDAGVWLETARDEAREGRNSASLSSIQALLQIDPNHAAAWQLKGGVLAKLHRFEEAAAAVEQYVRLAPDAEQEKIQSAKRFLKNLQLVNTPNDQLDVEGLCGKAVTLHQFGQSAPAVDCFDRALSFDANCLQAWNDRALALEALGRSDEAIASYDKALALQPDAAAAWFNRGNLLAGLGRRSEALESFRKFVRVVPPSLQHLLPEANAQITRLDPDAAAQIAIQIDPVIRERCEGLKACGYPAVLNMAKTYLNMFGWMNPSTLDRVIADTNKLLDIDGNDHGALALLGYAVLARRRASDGQRCFVRAKEKGNGAAALCGAYFEALTSFRNHAETDDAEAAGKALVDGMLSSPEAFTDKTALKMDLKSLELGDCIVVSTSSGGLVVPVNGFEGRFSARG